MSNGAKFSSHFRTYRLEWSPTNIHSFVDDELVGTMNSSEAGFLEFSNGFNRTVNPWVNGTKIAPFDQKVSLPYLIIFMPITIKSMESVFYCY